MYNSPEERAMIQAVAGNHDVPGVVVGVGSDIPARTDAARFRRKYNINRPFAIYVGRIDENKGCRELFDLFPAVRGDVPARPRPGADRQRDHANPAAPADPSSRVPRRQDKFDALAAADLLIMPSYFESLSMVALEAWAIGRPVLANGRCDVLKGQCIRSDGGPLLRDATRNSPKHSIRSNRTGRCTRGSDRTAASTSARHYAWPVIERKYLDMLDQLKREDAQAAAAGHGAAARVVRAPAPRPAAAPPRSSRDPLGRGRRPGGSSAHLSDPA